MFALAATGFILCVIAINLIALALAGHRWIGSYTLSRAATPAAAALALFFVEHFVGLGGLAWCWPLTTAAAVWLTWRQWATIAAHWRTEAAFAASFAWVFVWRLCYPGIVPSSEKLGDLAMIASYLPGARLPPEDVWLPPFKFDVYYSFQHYAASLLGRLFDLGPGLTYNLGFCLLVALTTFCAAGCAWSICRSTWKTALVVAAFAAGGTGASIPVHFMMRDPPLYASMRFIGDWATHGTVKTPFAQWLLAAGRVAPTDPVKMPTETFSYLLQLGDYHPPLSGFYLLMLALLCIARVEEEGENGAATAIMAATIPVCAIANGWSLPFQGLLVFAWLAYRTWDGRPIDWRMVAGGFLVSAALCYPFFSGFAYRTAAYNLKLKFLARNEHTPLLFGAIVLWPIVAAILLPLVSRGRARWILWMSGLWLVLFVFTETFYIDDIYAGPYHRFNTTLKWWPWIQAGALLTAGAAGLRSASRAARYATAAVLLLVTFYGVDLVRALATGYKGDFGRLDGAAWITDDPIERVVLEYLKAAPRSIVLQRLETGAFTPAPGIVEFAGQRAFIGWPEHEKLWRGQRADVMIREGEVKRFYAGEMPDAADWLLENRIDHVLWLKPEYKLPAGTFEKIDGQIRGAYYWREFYSARDFRVGVWSRSTVIRDAAPSPDDSRPRR
jgi:uncharacterized membrane protein